MKKLLLMLLLVASSLSAQINNPGGGGGGVTWPINSTGQTTTGQVPLTINGPLGQTADLTDWQVNTVTLAWVDNAGNIHAPSYFTTGPGAGYTDWTTGAMPVGAAGTVRCGANTGDKFACSDAGGAVTSVAFIAGDIGNVQGAEQINGLHINGAAKALLQTSDLSTSIANAGVTGTTVNKLAKLTGTGTAVITAITDTQGILGPVTGGAGTTGSAVIAQLGQASCIFDGAVTANDYVVNSPTVIGDCHDAGATVASAGTSQIIGRVLVTNGGAGTFNMLVMIGSASSAGPAVALSQLTGSAAQTTNTEVAAGNNITFAGIETGALTAPFVFQNTNSANNNSESAVIFNTAGTSTGAVPVVINETTGAGDLIDMFNGGTVTNGTIAGGTNEFKVTAGGVTTMNGNLNVNGGTIGGTAATMVLAATNTTGQNVLVRGNDPANSSVGGTVTLRGGGPTSGAGNTLAAGNVTVNGGDNAATGTAETGGSLTLRGGNCTAVATACTPGATSLTSGGQTAASTNLAAADLTIAAGLGTGNAATSHVLIKSPALSQTSGTTAETQVTRQTVHVKAGSTTSATATNIFNVALAANQTAGIQVFVHVETTQATPHNCSTAQAAYIVAQDTSATVTTQVQLLGTVATICDTGTLTFTVAASAAAPSVISVTPSWTTIVPTAVTISVAIVNLSQQDIALL